MNDINETFDWKKEYETQLAEQYPGMAIKWDGDNPTLVIPDELIAQMKAIVNFSTELWRDMGGEVEFYPNQAVHTEG